MAVAEIGQRDAPQGATDASDTNPAVPSWLRCVLHDCEASVLLSERDGETPEALVVHPISQELFNELRDGEALSRSLGFDCSPQLIV
jgi:hypothetical protein